jgi:hypothetical protein
MTFEEAAAVCDGAIPSPEAAGERVSGEGHESAAPTTATRSTSTTGSARPAGRGAVPLRRPCPALHLRAGPGPATNAPGTQSRTPAGRVRRAADPASDFDQPTAATARQPPCPATVHSLETTCSDGHSVAIRRGPAAARRASAVAGGHDLGRPRPALLPAASPSSSTASRAPGAVTIRSLLPGLSWTHRAGLSTLTPASVPGARSKCRPRRTDRQFLTLKRTKAL